MHFRSSKYNNWYPLSVRVLECVFHFIKINEKNIFSLDVSVHLKLLGLALCDLSDLHWFPPSYNERSSSRAGNQSISFRAKFVRSAVRGCKQSAGLVVMFLYMYGHFQSPETLFIPILWRISLINKKEKTHKHVLLKQIQQIMSYRANTVIFQ